MIVGTGTGGAIVIDQRLCSGPNAIAGEWGHNMLPWPRDDEWPGPPCYCGRTACIETFLSGPGLERDYASGRRPGADRVEIAVLRKRATQRPHAALARYEHRMARGLASVINVLDPHVIVLGGGMSNVKRLYQNVPRIWTEFVFSDRVDTRLVPPMHGDSSGVRGAAPTLVVAIGGRMNARTTTGRTRRRCSTRSPADRSGPPDRGRSSACSSRYSGRARTRRIHADTPRPGRQTDAGQEASSVVIRSSTDPRRCRNHLGAVE